MNPTNPPNLEQLIKNFNLPLGRRTFPRHLIAQEIVSVQPMTAPVGSLFYMDLKYGANAHLRCKLIKAGLETEFRHETVNSSSNG